MSSQDIPEEKSPAEQGAHVAVADEKHPFADPGLPPHEHRIQDVDERAARRSERTVALLFTVSMLATVGFIASYVAIPHDKSIFVFPIGHLNALNFALGLTLGLALFSIGAGGGAGGRPPHGGGAGGVARGPRGPAPRRPGQLKGREE
ncbi:hypothetical protein ACFXDP_29010, partial [Streptomyces sp. NPDC059374]